jgi:hypothetical protein
MFASLLTVVAATALAAPEFNGKTFDAGIAGKAAFVKFLAPW